MRNANKIGIKATNL